jgi:PAS domain S-box-containing protein
VTDGGSSATRSLGEQMFGERVLDAVPEVVFVLDPTGRLVWWNDRTLAVTGYTEAELASVSPLALFPDVDRDRAAQLFGGVTDGDIEDPPVFETALIDTDGYATPYEFVVSRLQNDDGSIAGVTATGRDLSDRHALQELERQNDRLDEFASLVSHDLRNPLTVAEGYLALARERADSAELERVAAAHERMYDLIEDLLSLARDGNTVGETTPISLEDAARSAWYNVGTDRTSLEVGDDRTVDANLDRLRNLFENLYRNAIEHSDGPDVVVRVGSTERGFYLEDDGPGVPVADRERVFESGYTTSESGTGFGLAIVRGICEAHDWSVWLVESASGGARFEIDTGRD